MYYIKSRSDMITRILISAAFGIFFSILSFSGYFSSAEGPLFHALEKKRPEIVPSSEILLLEADEESAAAAGSLPWDSETISEGLMILTEMKAQAVVLDSAVEKGNLLYSDLNDKLRDSFEREFTLIKDNIKTLFNAIRLGSVRPKDTASFVDDILSLTDKSKIRLMEASGSSVPDRMMYRHIYHAESPLDSSLRFIRPSLERLELPEISDPLVHAVLQAVLVRLGNPAVEESPGFLVLHKAFPDGKNESDIVIPLDKRGAILPEFPKGTPESSFRRISLNLLVRHSILEAELFNEIKAMEQAGYLSWSGEAMSPLALYEFSRKPGSIDTEDWRRLRKQFYRITAGFLSGIAEKKIDDGYSLLLESSTLTPEGKRNILALKNAARSSFDRAGKTFGELLKLRDTLEREIQSSICIIAPELKDPVSRVRAAAGLADALLSGHFFSIFPSLEAFLVSGLLAVFVSLILAALAPVSAAFAGIAAVILSAAAASLFFVHTGIWFNPLLAAGSAAAAAIVSVFTGSISAYRINESISRQSSVLLQLSKYPSLHPTPESNPPEGEKIEASIIAVRFRLNGITWSPDSSAGNKIISALHIYHETIGAVLRENGAFLYALEGEVIFASFGGRIPGKGHRIQAELAAAAVLEEEDKLEESFKNAGIVYKAGAVSVGIDTGLCGFGSDDIDGLPEYIASGDVPARAGILSGLGERYKCRILITEDVATNICEGFEAVKLDRIIPEIDKSRKYFFCLRRRQ